MRTASRIEEVLAQSAALESEQRAQLDALADGGGDLAAYVAAMAHRDALGDVLRLLRGRQRAETIARLERAEAEAQGVWQEAHATELEARHALDAALVERRRRANKRTPATPDNVATWAEIEHAVTEAQAQALAADYAAQQAGRALQEARAALEAAKGSEA